NAELPDGYRDGGQHQLDPVKAGTKTQILPGMYAYSKVIIDRPDAMALPEAALVRQGDRTFCWMHENGRAVRTEIQVGITDGEWVEVTNRNKPAGPGGADPWLPFEGSEQVILGDLSILTDGGTVSLVRSEDSKTAPAAGLTQDSGRR